MYSGFSFIVYEFMPQKLIWSSHIFHKTIANPQKFRYDDTRFIFFKTKESLWKKQHEHYFFFPCLSQFSFFLWIV